MRHERQVELLRRLQGVDAPRPGPLGAMSVRNPASAYTSSERWAAERRVLFEGRPCLVGLSCEVRDAGSYLTGKLGTVPVAVARQEDGRVRAFVNICRHRGATPLPAEAGCGLTAIRCPYHAWTYGLDGALRAFPGAEAGFDDVDKASAGLIELPVAEKYGLIFAVADPAHAPFTVDEALHGAQEELADYGLGHYELIESRTRERAMNWKLVMDTFTEPYHIPWLHKETIAPYYLFDRWIHDTYGPHHRFIGTRKSVMTEFDKPSEDDWDLLPHGTIEYLLVPNAVLTHQLDHLELWRLEPVAVNRTIVRTAVYAPGPPATAKARDYYVKNLDVLLDVTNGEDFPLQEQVQRNLESGALAELVYGKMEPVLAAYHTSVAKALADAGEASS